MIRAVDWSTEKADEREARGKNRTDPYIAACAQGIPDCEYTRSENLDFDTGKPCIFRGLGKSPLIHKCIERNIDYYYIVITKLIYLRFTNIFHNHNKKSKNFIYHIFQFNTIKIE